MKFFEFSNTSGEIFRAKFNTKQEKIKAYKRMWNYYDNDSRMHPIFEFLRLEEPKEKSLYDKAKQGSTWAIQRCLRIMWSRTDLFSFYGKIVTIK